MKTVNVNLLEISFGKEKWAYAAAYKPPSLPDTIFTTNFNRMIEDLTANYEKIIAIFTDILQLMSDPQSVIAHVSGGIY